MEVNSKPQKKSKSAEIDELEASELADGLEKEYQRSYVGMANISLDNISISKDLDVKVNQFRVYRIIM